MFLYFYNASLCVWLSCTTTSVYIHCAYWRGFWTVSPSANALATLELWIVNKCMYNDCASEWLHNSNGQGSTDDAMMSTSITMTQMDNNMNRLPSLCPPTHDPMWAMVSSQDMSYMERCILSLPRDFTQHNLLLR